MVKHVVMWKMKEGQNDPMIKKAMKENLEALNGEIKEIKSLVFYTDLEETSTHDVILVSEFESMEDLQSYAKNPKHVHVAETYIKPYVENRVCADYTF
jgi:putative stress responsive A/B barrel domain protein